MTQPRRFRLIDVSTLLLVLAVAAGARGWYVQECADSGRSDGPIRVQDRPPPSDPLAALRLVGAGISNAMDVKTALALGADGWGVSSAFTKSKDPERTLTELVEASSA